MPQPALLLEVHTRSWLRELSKRLGTQLSLADVPDEQINRWQALGFTHVWLMGVWQVGPEARCIALDHWRREWRNETPSTEDDLDGSPFAISGYAVDSRLGQPLDLLMLKERLGNAGIKLILDFVPNHLGIDSPEPRRYPARFVQSPFGGPGTFLSPTRLGPRFFAHGRDPYFPPWQDTVQIDYRVAEAQEAMGSIGQTISMFCHGLRCDMAMLVLPDVFNQVWKALPAVGERVTRANFWRAAIPKIRQLQSSVDLIAEVYWNREAELQDAGFDFTYNKRVTDFLMNGQDSELQDYLNSCSPDYLERSVHFLENHDEPRAASRLPLRRHKAAAALILFLPGMTLLHDGQIEGRKRFARIQITRRPDEPGDPELQAFYSEILHILQQTNIRRGQAELVKTEGKLIVVRWTARNEQVDLGIVNLTPDKATLRISPAAKSAVLFSTHSRLEVDTDAIVVPAESAHILRLTEPDASSISQAPWNDG